MGWISVKDKLPDEDGRYLVFTSNSTMIIVGFAKSLKDVDEYELPASKPGWYNYDSEYGYYECTSITHWRKLPEPPEEVN